MTSPTARPKLPQPARPRMSRGRLWSFRLIAVLLGLMPFVLLEGVFRLCGVGHDLSLVVPVPGAAEWYRLNHRFDEPFFGQADLSGPEPRPFRLPKPPHLRRILVVGGSTVIGFPYVPELAFPRIMERQLRGQLQNPNVAASTKPAKAETEIEVLNAGITALNSTSEVAVVEEGLQTQPDLLVIYSGHNEFYGPGGVASSIGQISPDAFRSAARWRRLRWLQLINGWLTPRAAAAPDLMESLPTSVQIQWGSPPFQETTSRFGDNLRTMIELARAARVPVLLVSPACNLADQPPLQHWQPPAGQVRPGSWEAALRTALEAYDQSDWAAARTAFEQVLRTGGHHQAVSHYLLGRVLLELGEPELARQRFHEAVDLDGARFRAPRAQCEKMQELARQYTGQNVYFVDLPAALDDFSDRGIAGRDLFFEHVHFTRKGNQVVGQILSRFIWEEIWKRSWNEQAELSADELQRDMGHLPEDDLAALALALLVYDKQPFQQAYQADQLRQSLAIQLHNQASALSPERQQLFDSLSLSELSHDPLEALLARRDAAQMAADGDLLRSAVQRQPWSSTRRKRLAEWLREQGDTARADDVSQAGKNWP